jgi:hypothetical protein
MNLPMNMATLIPIIGVLVALTNIIVEVVKKVTWDKIPTNLLAVIIAIVLTLAVFFAWMSINNYAIVWYYIAGTVVVGILVAYAAMFGFDKLKEIISGFEFKKSEK